MRKHEKSFPLLQCDRGYRLVYMPPGPLLCFGTHTAHGRYTTALACFLQCSRERPRQVATVSQLAFLALRGLVKSRGFQHLFQGGVERHVGPSAPRGQGAESKARKPAAGRRRRAAMTHGGVRPDGGGHGAGEGRRLRQRQARRTRCGFSRSGVRGSLGSRAGALTVKPQTRGDGDAVSDSEFRGPSLG